MKRLYYLLWVDAIVNSAKYKADKHSNIFKVFYLITISNTLNFFTICLWLKLFNIINYNLNLEFFPDTLIFNAAGFLIQFSLPFILLNYFLVLHNKRYEKIIIKYPKNKGGVFAFFYGISSVLISFISVILYGVYK